MLGGVSPLSLVIATFNLSDFPEMELARYGIRALQPDDFLVEFLDATPEAFVPAVQSHRLALKNSPQTPDEYMARLVESGLKQIALRLEAYRNNV